jgi:AcrR family transcriptional regulator
MQILTDEGVAAGRREERKAQNRAKLMIAARKVFAEKGLGAATARDIVRETDLAAGTFYNYFDDKDDIFRALLGELTVKARAAVRAQRQTPGTLEERIERAYRAYFDLAAEERELFAVFRRNVGVIALMDGPGLAEAGVSELVEDLREWADAGELPDVDFDYLAMGMVGLGVHVATQLIDRDPPDPQGAARFCTGLVLSGLRGLGEGARTGNGCPSYPDGASVGPGPWITKK